MKTDIWPFPQEMNGLNVRWRKLWEHRGEKKGGWLAELGAGGPKHETLPEVLLTPGREGGRATERWHPGGWRGACGAESSLRECSSQEKKGTEGLRQADCWAFTSPVKIWDSILVEIGSVWKILTEGCQDEVDHSGCGMENGQEGEDVRGQSQPMTNVNSRISLENMHCLQLSFHWPMFPPTKNTPCPVLLRTFCMNYTGGVYRHWRSQLDKSGVGLVLGTQNAS